MKDPKAPCKNCKHLGESIFNRVDPPDCFYCKPPYYGYWEPDLEIIQEEMTLKLDYYSAYLEGKYQVTILTKSKEAAEAYARELGINFDEMKEDEQ